MNRLYSCVPLIDERWTHQARAEDISDEEFTNLCQDIQFRWYHRLYQVICFIVFLGPIRLLVFGAAGAFCISLVVAIRLIARSLGFHPDNVRTLGALIARLGFRFIFLGFGNVWLKIRGDVDGSARFIIANHVSILDAFAICLVRDVTTCIDKRWVRTFFSRTFFDNANPVYVTARHCGNTKGIIDRADDSSQFPVLLFHEEAQTNGHVLLQFHRGAFLTPYKVQPMLIRYWMLLVPKGWNTIASVGQSFASYLWQLASMPLFVVDIDCLPSMTMEVEGKADIDKFAKNAQIFLANHLKIKAIARSSKDVKSALAARGRR
jgi:1-acyl-sn-glycerol-3-phosphate acyltransferase